MKYPIGIQNFEKLVTEGFVYVDKTALIYQLAQEGNYYFLSRPRRFGKSLLISTMEAYFSGQKDLFKGMAVESLEKEWRQHPILHLDLNVGEYQDEASLRSRLDVFLTEAENIYGRTTIAHEPGQRLELLIKRAYERTGERIVILVDEYDKPLLQAIGNEQLQNIYRIILNGFYGALKSCDRYIRFAFLTGVTKFGKVSVFSDLNNLQDLSMSRKYQTICGITEEDIKLYFTHSIKELADNYGLTPEKVLNRLRNRYDGYHFRQNGIGIYNPFSLLSTFQNNEFGSYWFEMGTPSYLVELLKKENYRLPNLTEEQVSSDFLNSIDSVNASPIPVIYQSGYLTIKEYDERFDVFRLGFPNEEVEEGFTRYLMPFYTHVQKGESAFFVRNFIMDLEKGNAEGFMKRMATMMADTDYKIVGDAELYFQNAFYIIAKMLGFYTEVERTTSNGRMDMVIKTKDYIYIVEFKMDGSADKALQQIADKGYDKPFTMDERQIIKIGVNFSLGKRCIEEWKVE